MDLVKNNSLVRLILGILLLAILDFGIRTYEIHSVLSQKKEVYEFISEWTDSVSEISKIENKYPGARSTAEDRLIEDYVNSSNQLGTQIYRSNLELERKFVFPWHRKIQLAKTDTLTYFNGWVSFLQSVSLKDGFVNYGNNSWNPENEVIRMNFSLQEAIPKPDIFKLLNKIN